MPRALLISHALWRSSLLPALVLLALLGVALVGAYLRKYLGPVSVDQVLYHLQFGGLDRADPRLWSRAARYLAGWLATGALLAWLHARLRARGRMLLWAALLGLTAWSVKATVVWTCVQPEPIQGRFMQQHYVEPSSQRFARLDGPAPDVLLVYLESVEARLVNRRHMPALAAWRAQQAQDLGSLHMLSGASWTMGGLFASQCGLPLMPVGLMSRHALEYATRFFPGGRCLSDILVEQGWEASFYGGASLKFAGKGQFLADHQVERRFGREQWQARHLEGPPNGWGVLDAALTQAAWDDLQRPRTSDRPRLAVLLTVNTHGPQGVDDEGCGQRGGEALDADAQWHRALQCSGAVVAQLAQRFAQWRNGRPKLIWLMGDHLSPLPLLASEAERANAQAWRERPVFHALARFDAHGRADALALPAPRRFSHLDVLPTVLEAAGLRWGPQSGRLALGVSLLQAQQPTLVEREGFARLDGQLSCPAPLYQRLWRRERPPSALSAGSAAPR